MDTSKSPAELGLGPRLVKGLVERGVSTTDELLLRTEWELWRFPNFGYKGVGEVRSVLAEHGLSLHHPTPEEVLQGR